LAALCVTPEHGDKYPLPVSFLEYIGPSPSRAGPPIANAALAGRLSQGDTLLSERGDYSFYDARYSVHPRRHEKRLAQFGAGVVVLYRDTLVAAAHKHFVWVHSEHRGQKLAREMAITWFLWMGQEVWLQDHKDARYTQDGLDLRLDIYKKMVERGIFEEPAEKPERVLVTSLSVVRPRPKSKPKAGGWPAGMPKK
jgi:hypothetical protein